MVESIPDVSFLTDQPYSRSAKLAEDETFRLGKPKAPINNDRLWTIGNISSLKKARAAPAWNAGAKSASLGVGQLSVLR